MYKDNNIIFLPIKKLDSEIKEIISELKWWKKRLIIIIKYSLFESRKAMFFQLNSFLTLL